MATPDMHVVAEQLTRRVRHEPVAKFRQKASLSVQLLQQCGFQLTARARQLLAEALDVTLATLALHKQVRQRLLYSILVV
jgi:hypothetical protein